ncbi:hypothetical protein nc8_1358 [Lactiplantibacillus plantarum subsp. plantarum NC8]|nr:hypothetical protein nc8_1358 [Lactiplantibacillus plantarum subsp. plantarum NC8]
MQSSVSSPSLVAFNIIQTLLPKKMQAVSISLLPVMTVSQRGFLSCTLALYNQSIKKELLIQDEQFFFNYLIFGVFSMVSVLPAAQRWIAATSFSRRMRFCFPATGRRDAHVLYGFATTVIRVCPSFD